MTVVVVIVVVIGRAAPQLLLDWPSELQWSLLHRHVELDEVTAAEGFLLLRPLADDADEQSYED